MGSDEDDLFVPPEMAKNMADYINDIIQAINRLLQKSNICIYSFMDRSPRRKILKKSSAEKVPLILHSYEFMEFFHTPKFARLLDDENVSSPALLKVTLVFIQSYPTFIL